MAISAYIFIENLLAPCMAIAWLLLAPLIRCLASEARRLLQLHISGSRVRYGGASIVVMCWAILPCLSGRIKSGNFLM